MTRRMDAIATLIAVALLVAAGCSSSSSQTKADEEPTTDETKAEAETNESAESKKGAAADKKPAVDLEKIVGMDTSSGMPDGCPGEWGEIKGRSFPGKVYACDGFRAPELYPDASVVIGVKDNTVRRLSMQAFYASGEATSEAYYEIKDGYQQRCDREGGSGEHVVLQCEGFLVDLSMQRETQQVRVVFGLENWDLPN